MILALISGFILGIALGSFFPINIWFFVAGITLAVICFLYRYFVPGNERVVITIASVFIFGLLCGVGRMAISDLYSSSHLDSLIGKKINTEGIIVTEPDVREHNTKLTIYLTDYSENILVTIPIYPEFNYGDKVSVSTTLERPKNIESEDGRVFDYNGYLRARGIWYTGNFAQVKFISSGNGNPIKNALFKIKHSFTNSLSNALPEPESSLMSGLLLGTKQSLGKDLLSEFQRSGTSHIVVLSGYNIAIVAESIMALLSFLPKTFSFGIGALSIIFFTILSGGGASATRAAIMVLVALSAKKLNRDYKASRALGFAVVLMLTPNPLLLIFDPSFQLSLLATIGLIFVTPHVSPYLTKVTEKYGLREVISSTIATQIIVLPFLIYNTGILSLVSLPVNVLVLGTIPLTMFFGFITGIFGLVSLYLSFIPALPAYILLWYQLTIIHIGATLPFGAINLPSFSFLVLILVYLVIFLVLYFLKQSRPKGRLHIL